MENQSIHVAIFLVLSFTAITMLQSGLDKMLDWKGNMAWLKDHFGKTFLRGVVPLLVGVILIMEVISGILAIAGMYTLIVLNSTTTACWALSVAAITLLMLLFGQRVAKDYPGAFTITGYFMVVTFGIFLTSL